METKVDTEPRRARVSTLVSGIIQDSRQLLSQQLLLFQVEIKNDVRRAIAAAVPMMIGAVICVLAVFMFLHAAALFLCWIVPDLPLWVGYGAVGAAAALIGICLAVWGAIQFQKFNPLPEKTLEGLKENLQWKIEP